VSIAMVRDGQAGAAMARVMSFVMMVFMLVPMLAPSIGTLVLLFANWRVIFVGFLVVGCAVLGLVSFLAIAAKPRRTRQGDAVVHGAWTRFRESGQQQAWRNDKQTAECAPLAAALFGTTTLVGTAYATVHTAITAMQGRDNGGSGCGSSGGDGGGGGCGGCGGCGGGGD
jgi:uncharacterized membrane protein YgcG